MNPGKNPDRQVAILVFESGQKRLAVPIRRIHRVAACPELLLPARYPDFVLGFFNFRGATCTVLSLHRLVGLGDATPPGFYTPLIVFAANDGWRALAIDDIEATLPEGRWSPLPVGEEFADYPVACLVDDGSDKPPACLDIDALLLAEEEACLADLAESIRERISDVQRFSS